MKNNNDLKLLIFPAASAFLLAVARLPWQLGFLSYCAFIPLIYFFDLLPSRQNILRAALLFSLIYCLVALHWINLVTVPGFFGMIILFSLYFLIMFNLNGIVWKRNFRWRYLAFILIWLSFEHLQNFGQFSFPWFYSGYSLADYTVLLQPAEIGGVSLISLYVIITNLLIYQYIRQRKKPVLIMLVLLHLAWTGLSSWRYHSIELINTGEKAGIVQVSIPQNIKWKKAYRDSTFELYHQYTGKISQDTGLVIFPESAIPGYVLHRYSFYNFVRKLVTDYDKSIFTGFPDLKYLPQKDEYLYYNSCSLFDSTGFRYKPYHKKILVPFGERIPLLNVMPVLNQIELGQANWEYGDSLRYYFYKNLKFTPQICFEVAFPGLNAQMARKNPVFVANLTNDAWFHYSAGTYQHALMTRFRAIETRTQYFRSANTGYSMIIDPKGDILAKTELFTKETIESYIYDHPHQTVFVRCGYLLPHFLAACTALLLLWSILKRCELP